MNILNSNVIKIKENSKIQKKLHVTIHKSNINKTIIKKEEFKSAVPSKITDSIYQGNIHSAKNKEYLKSIGITHILVAGRLTIYFPNDFIYKKYEIFDTPLEKIDKYFNDAYEFINEAINNNGKILIHCAAGVSRSSSFTISYLIKSKMIKYDEAMLILKKGRKIANPNIGFQKQLRNWEKECLSGKVES